MKKHFSWIALVLIIAIVFASIACKHDIIVDTTAPGEITNLIITVVDGNAVLTWMNPADADFVGVQISMSPAEGILSNPISLKSNITSFSVKGLKSDVTYVFTIKTYDNKFNYSYGVEKIIVIDTSDKIVPVITSVSIPIAGEGYTGELPVTIMGQNLLGNEITCSDESFRNVTVLNNTKATATIRCSGIVGEKSITVTSGTSSANGTLKVINAEKCFSVGDVLLTDGTFINVENIQYGLSDEQRIKAFGVIASAPYGGGTGNAVGLKMSSSSLTWAPSGTTGCDTNFEEIQVSKSGSASSGYVFTGDLDGSDNWEYIRSIDPEGTQYDASYYPVFSFANIYGITAGLTGTAYEEGWYIPSIAELYDVYKNKDTIHASFAAIGESTIGTGLYWSSSQCSSVSNYAYELNFSDGDVGYNYKKNNFSVLVLHVFNAGQFNNSDSTEPNPDDENRDTTPPSQVLSVFAEYFAAENSIEVSWINPQDSDFAEIVISYGKTNSTERSTLTFDKSYSSTVITGIVADDSEYSISVSTKDSSGNISEPKMVTVQAVNNEIIPCDVRTGDYVLSDNTYVKKEYYPGLTQAERNSIVGVVCVIDSGEPLILGTKFPETYLSWTTSQTGLDTYFANISVAATAQTSSDYDITYTFTGDVDGSDNWEYISSMDENGALNSASTYPAFYYATMYPYVAGLVGTDFVSDWYVPSIK